MNSAAATSHKKGIERKRALSLAIELIEILKPLCFNDQIVMAGSLRRKKQIVNDIELLCIPRQELLKKPDEIFPKNRNLVVEWIEANNNKQVQSLKGGERYQQFLYQGVQIDLFMTTIHDFGRMFAIRTGPESFSKKIAVRWKELGYKGIDGLLRDIKTGELAPPFYSEPAFFDWLGMAYIEPEAR